IDHRVDGVLEFEDFAFDIDGNFLGQVAVGDSRGDVGDIAHLAGQVAGHRIDAVGQVFPGAGHALDVGLAAWLAFGPHFAGRAGPLHDARPNLIDHRVDGVLEFEDFAFDIDGDFLGQVAIGHGRGDVGDVTHLAREVAGHRVDAVGQVFPGAGHAFHL